MIRMATMVGLIAIAIAALGCGGSGSGGAGGKGGVAGGGGGGAGGGTVTHVTWQDDGTSVTAIAGSAVGVLIGAREALQIAGGTNDLEIEITVEDDPPLMPNTFRCNQPSGSPSATFGYFDRNASPLPTSPECTVTITQIGAMGVEPAIGTFSATFVLPSGASRNITNGSFNVPQVGPTN